MLVVWAAERQRSVAKVRALPGGRVLVVMAALGVVLHRADGLQDLLLDGVLKSYTAAVWANDPSRAWDC